MKKKFVLPKAAVPGKAPVLPPPRKSLTELKPKVIPPSLPKKVLPPAPKPQVDQAVVVKQLWLDTTVDTSRLISKLVNLCGASLPEDELVKLGACAITVMSLLRSASKKLTKPVGTGRLAWPPNAIATVVSSLTFYSGLAADLNSLCETAAGCTSAEAVADLTRARDIASAAFLAYLAYAVKTYPSVVQHPEFKCRTDWYEKLKEACSESARDKKTATNVKNRA